MSRLRCDRSASKGRPKRRAAATHLFKYQLSSNPSRAEENAIKKALQESLEETHTVNGGKKRSKTIVNSANNSDVSRSNISSSSSNESAGSISISLGKRTRSSDTTNITSTPMIKRAKLNNTGANHRNNKSDDNLSSNGNGPVVSPNTTPSIQTGKAIKTYSRSQPNFVSQQTRKQTNNNSGASSSLKRSTQNNNDKETRSASSSQTSVSKSTQTTAVSGKNIQVANKTISNGVKSTTTSCPLVITQTTETLAPVQDQYLKFKRESKNYAYVKMTALKVSTSKSPSNNPRLNSKKSSPNSVLNNNITNKDSATKVSPKANSPDSPDNNSSSTKKTPDGTPNNVSRYQSKSSTSKADTSSGKKSPTNISTKPGPHNGKATDNTSKISRTSNVQTEPQSDKRSIPKQDLDVNTDADGSKNDCSDDTVDLSNKKNQNQANVKVAKKRSPQGSWSLLGVPEEKVIYLRDDEPPRRMICYPAIKHVEGDVIQVRDSVLLRSGARKTDLPYIAKVCAFWEDADTGGVMMSLFWYYRPEHTEEGRKPHHLVDEVFASRHRDVDSVECIEDKCYVLTFNEYCRYRKRCKMEQVNTTWSLADVTIPVSNESYPRRNRIPDSDVNPELVFCCRQIYDSRMRKLIKNPLINPKYGNI